MRGASLTGCVPRKAGLVVSRAFRPWRELLADVREYLAPDIGLIHRLPGQLHPAVTLGRDGRIARIAQPGMSGQGYGLSAHIAIGIFGKNRDFTHILPAQARQGEGRFSDPDRLFPGNYDLTTARRIIFQ